MTIELELYRGDNQDHVGDYMFAAVLRRAARMQFGDHARRGQVEIVIEGPPDTSAWTGPPEVRNLATESGHCRLRLIHDGGTVEERVLRVVDLLGPALADDLRAMDPVERRWAFRLRSHRSLTLLFVGGEVSNRISGEVRPAPKIEGAIDVDPGERRHLPFTLTPMAGADEELVSPEDLGLDPDRLGRINVLLPTEIHDQLVRSMPLVTTMEEGGFLLGRVTRAGDRIHLVEITHVTPAHRSGAGLIHFTFTGESFLSVAQLIEARGQSEELVGWYHTHLFNAGKMGLSAIDVDLHLATFQRPWQLAALINIGTTDRVLRFYGRDDGKDLREYDQWISDDGRTYRPVRTAMGGR